MSERVFRLITGMVLWAILLVSTIYQNNTLMIVFCIVLLLEGITNWRIPTIVSKIRFGQSAVNSNQKIDEIKTSPLNHIEAERMMRFVVVLFLLISFFSLPNVLWFFPWYVAGMMIVSGISNICPMVMFLRWVGFR
ncbi:MAG: DUF2892 domain-containing protein [Gammaproteobacteria bacterium]|nr:DUF2892 domain-containing protein [Gammaproteobacteria bacterium]